MSPLSITDCLNWNRGISWKKKQVWIKRGWLFEGISVIPPPEWCVCTYVPKWNSIVPFISHKQPQLKQRNQLEKEIGIKRGRLEPSSAVPHLSGASLQYPFIYHRLSWLKQRNQLEKRIKRGRLFEGEQCLGPVNASVKLNCSLHLSQTAVMCRFPGFLYQILTAGIKTWTEKHRSRISCRQ